MKGLWLSLGILLLFSSCSRKTEEELLKDAQTARDQKNYQLAIESYQELADHYPNSKNAEPSQLAIAAVYNNEMHDFGKAADAYYKFYTMFPSSKDAPSALFLTGFLLSNELHRYDSAKTMYETFLQKYPDHELVASVKFELNTLGKNPEQFLPPGVTSKEDSSSAEKSKQ
jgi:outer membrane protein assembly factor BamD (BamD/ComL family)